MSCRVVQVSLVDGSIEIPGQLPAGPITFEVTDNGMMEHNFEFEGQGIEEGWSFYRFCAKSNGKIPAGSE